jgi:hypothetical protein
VLAFEAADGFASAFAFGLFAFEAGARGWVHARFGDRDAVEGGVELAVAAAVESVALYVAEWEEWTEMALPESGAYVVSAALLPIEIDRERDEGVYDEPNVWMVHSPRPPNP